MKAILLTSLALLSVVGPQLAAAKARFEFQLPPSTDSFVFELTDPTLINRARSILNGTTEDTQHVYGKIVKYKQKYNEQWSFHLDPDTVKFFDMSTEVCDSSIEYLEMHLGEACGAFLPDCNWCPWSSTLIKEVTSLD
ncbi:hypothetical protein GQ42DRAFT_169566 [Ramicandelaber brevisporus]|nr:hypothetical protein GQ42DRAFT_169566 [Ramicandelaber brevisporus]